VEPIAHKQEQEQEHWLPWVDVIDLGAFRWQDEDWLKELEKDEEDHE
jgi:hypothetical protein